MRLAHLFRYRSAIVIAQEEKFINQGFHNRGVDVRRLITRLSGFKNILAWK